MRSVIVIALFLETAFGVGLAPLFTHRQTIDNGGLRSYLILFNSQAPRELSSSVDKIQDWVSMELPLINPKEVKTAWKIGEDFCGFSAFLSSEGLASVRAHSFVQTVEENTLATIDQSSFTSRNDWGQVRVNQGDWNLATTPAGLYKYQPNSPSYANGGNPTTGTNGWNWATNVQKPFAAGGTGVIICIADTGINQNHQEFTTGRNRVTAARSFVDGTTADENGHGTHCAGSAAGYFRGVASNATLVNSKVLAANGSGSLDAVMNGVQYCTSFVDSRTTVVLSMSLSSVFSATLNNAITSAANAGVIPVVAAGNNYGANACTRSPASSDNAITVAATTSSDTIASFSNIGTCVNILSPGENIHSSWIGSTTAYNTISGTSMATPLVAGVVALLADPSLGLATLPLRFPKALDLATQYGTKNKIANVPNGTPNTLARAPAL